MIASATQATITIAVAADRPPTKTRNDTAHASFFQWKGKHVGIGVHAAAEDQHAGDCNGNDEQVD